MRRRGAEAIVLGLVAGVGTLLTSLYLVPELSGAVGGLAATPSSWRGGVTGSQEFQCARSCPTLSCSRCLRRRTVLGRCGRSSKG